MATGMSKESDLPGSLWLEAGGGCGIAILVLPQGAGRVQRHEWCWQGGTGRAAALWSHSLCRASKGAGSRGLALRKLPAKDCGGQPPLAPLAFSGITTVRRGKPPSST